MATTFFLMAPGMPVEGAIQVACIIRWRPLSNIEVGRHSLPVTRDSPCSRALVLD